MTDLNMIEDKNVFLSEKREIAEANLIGVQRTIQKLNIVGVNLKEYSPYHSIYKELMSVEKRLQQAINDVDWINNLYLSKSDLEKKDIRHLIVFSRENIKKNLKESNYEARDILETYSKTIKKKVEIIIGDIDPESQKIKVKANR